MAAQVQAETIPDAMRPGLTDREADVNSSEFRGETPVYLDWMAVKPTMKALKNNPIPSIASACEAIVIRSCEYVCLPTTGGTCSARAHAIRVNVTRTDAIPCALRKYLTLGHGHAAKRGVFSTCST